MIQLYFGKDHFEELLSLDGIDDIKVLYPCISSWWHLNHEDKSYPFHVRVKASGQKNCIYPMSIHSLEFSKQSYLNDLIFTVFVFAESSKLGLWKPLDPHILWYLLYVSPHNMVKAFPSSLTLDNGCLSEEGLWKAFTVSFQHFCKVSSSNWSGNKHSLHYLIMVPYLDCLYQTISPNYF